MRACAALVALLALAGCAEIGVDVALPSLLDAAPSAEAPVAEAPAVPPDAAALETAPVDPVTPEETAEVTAEVTAEATPGAEAVTPVERPAEAPPADSTPVAGLPAPTRADAGAAPGPGAPLRLAQTEERFAAAARAPHIYMSLQHGRSGPVSVVFAIDASADGTPGDDPAIRLTPDGGKCNPQELGRYDFPAADAARPVFSPDDVLAGRTARELPALMAIAVTSAMLKAGLIERPEQSQPQNVCTRKLWEQMVVNSTLAEG